MLGEVNGKELGIAFVELIELARAIRGKLGCRKYLLTSIFFVCWRWLTPSHIWICRTMAKRRAGSFANSAVRQFAERDAVGETRIGSTVQAYVATHPYPFL